MKMNVSLGQLEKTAKVKHEKKAKSKGYKKTVRSSSFPLECNLIGMRVDEALAVVDKYLDNAILNRAGSVRIVHGMGTGALRKAVHNYLKKQPKVESFRMGAQGDRPGSHDRRIKTERKTLRWQIWRRSRINLRFCRLFPAVI